MAAMATKTRARMKGRCEELLATWEDCLRVFSERSTFSGPSVHFHARALAMRNYRPLRDVVSDRQWIETLYATLASWGMHRMGPRGAKLVEFENFCRGVGSIEAELVALESLHLWDLGADTATVAATLWRLIEKLQVSETKTQIVAGSKTLHHLLPDLVPPIDRQYTLRFFYGSNPTNLARRQEAVFAEVFAELAGIAQDPRAGLAGWRSTGDPMDSSPTKRLDNGIVGFMAKRGRGANS